MDSLMELMMEQQPMDVSDPQVYLLQQELEL